MVSQSHIFENNAVTIVKRAKYRTRYMMGFRISEERCLVSIKAQSLLRKAEAVKATRGSKLDAQKTAEKNNDESCYFTRLWEVRA